MDAAVVPLPSTTEQLDPRVLPLKRDSEFWGERWHSLRKEVILFTSHRGGRPGLPCAAPPGEVPLPPNRTNHLSPLTSHLSSVYSRRPALGTAEVLWHHRDHSRTFGDLNPREALEIVELWARRYRALGEREYVNHILIFEREASGPRVAFENSAFMDCLPFFPRNAYKVFILPLRPAAFLTGPEIGGESTANESDPDQKQKRFGRFHRCCTGQRRRVRPSPRRRCNSN
jgi:hypothetical protein